MERHTHAVCKWRLLPLSVLCCCLFGLSVALLFSDWPEQYSSKTHLLTFAVNFHKWPLTCEKHKNKSLAKIVNNTEFGLRQLLTCGQSHMTPNLGILTASSYADQLPKSVWKPSSLLHMSRVSFMCARCVYGRGQWLRRTELKARMKGVKTCLWGVFRYYKGVATFA